MTRRNRRNRMSATMTEMEADTGGQGPNRGEERPVAVVDIGSGAIKLLVSNGNTLARQAFQTRLIAGDEDRVSDEAIEATARALDSFVDILEEHRPSRLAAVGTAVTRTATNAEVIQSLVRDRLGVPLEVLSGPREAELAFAGAMVDRDIDGVVSVMDIGAGSTEFASRLADGSMTAMSLPIGGRILTDQYLDHDPPHAAELSSALSIVELHLVDLRRESPAIADAIENGTVMAVGAAAVIASVEVGSNDPDHRVDGYRLEKAGLEEVFRALATESADDRRHNPGLKPQHVDDIVGAMCVLVEFMRQFAVPEVIISERGLLHGLAAELLAEG